VRLSPSQDQACPELSPSQVKQYQACPERWAKRKIDRIKVTDDSGDAAAIGTAVHGVLEAAGRAWVAAREVARPTVEQLHSALAAQALAPDLHDSAAEILATLQPDLDLSRCCLVEHEIALDLGEVKLAGYVDRIDHVDDHVYVIDYKTGQLPSTDLALDAQVGIYLVWARLTWPTAEITAVWDYLAHRTRRRVRWTPELDRYHRREVIATAAAMRGRWRVARPGQACAWCPYTGACSDYHRWLAEGLGPESAESASLSSLAAAYAAARELAKAADAQRKELGARLLAMLGEDKTRTDGTARVTRVRTTRHSYGPEAVLAVADATGDDACDVWRRAWPKPRPSSALAAYADAEGIGWILREQEQVRTSEHVRVGIE